MQVTHVEALHELIITILAATLLTHLCAVSRHFPFVPLRVVLEAYPHLVICGKVLVHHAACVFVLLPLWKASDWLCANLTSSLLTGETTKKTETSHKAEAAPKKPETAPVATKPAVVATKEPAVKPAVKPAAGRALLGENMHHCCFAGCMLGFFVKTSFCWRTLTGIYIIIILFYYFIVNI